MKNKCNTLTRKTLKRYFEYIAKNENFATSKTFWNEVRPFITNEDTILDENITSKPEKKKKKIKISKLKNKNRNKLISIKTVKRKDSLETLAVYIEIPLVT